MQDTIDKVATELINIADEESTIEIQEPILSEPVLCCYVNTSNRIQVARLSHFSEGDWEHIFFPGQHFMFEAPPEANLVIYKSPSLSMTVPVYISCVKLQVPTH